ncbi:MAG: MerR family transcriptional regulator [Betaproteobacteria bacterium]|nr:MerR family transcriptional regulator [Betaproteobacteria bacterium]
MYTIGKAAMLAGVTPDTLRYYEKERLITPASKTASGYRLYDDGALQRIRFIKTAQHCGFSISEIQELLKLKRSDAACCEDVRAIAIEKRLRIESKLRALQAMSAALSDLIEHCEGGRAHIDDCAILAALENGIREAGGER